MCTYTHTLMGSTGSISLHFLKTMRPMKHLSLKYHTLPNGCRRQNPPSADGNLYDQSRIIP